MSKLKTLLAGAILFVTAICAAPSLSAQCSSAGYGYAPSGYDYSVPSVPNYNYSYPSSSSYGFSGPTGPGYSYNAPGTSYRNPNPTQQYQYAPSTQFQNPSYQYQTKQGQGQYYPQSNQPMAPQSNR